jgi:hypothetical protein
MFIFFFNLDIALTNYFCQNQCHAFEKILALDELCDAQWIRRRHEAWS